MRNKQFLTLFLLISLIFLSQSSIVFAQPIITRTIDVQGLGVAPVEPNGAYFDIGLENVSTNLPEAYRNVRRQMGSVMDALIAIGVAPEDIRLTDLSISPQDRVDERQAANPSGEFFYRTTVLMRVTVRQIALLDAVVQTAVDVGANTVGNFFALYDDLSVFEQRARQAALNQAQFRAQELADAYGLAIKNPIDITERVITGISEVLLADATSGRFNVSVFLTVRYEVEPIIAP
jgi:uncharacterized protein YggE